MDVDKACSGEVAACADEVLTGSSQMDMHATACCLSPKSLHEHETILQTCILLPISITPHRHLGTQTAAVMVMCNH